MRHNRAYRKLGRTNSHRLATLRALSTALFERERIRTTLIKAKELRPFAEKLITKSKRDDLHARRVVMRHIRDKGVAKKLFDTLSPRYVDRPGGYMRILRLGPRIGDGSEMAIVELIGSEPVFSKKKEEPKRRSAGLASRLMGGKKQVKPTQEPPAEEAEASKAKSKAKTKTGRAEPSKRGKKVAKGRTSAKAKTSARASGKKAAPAKRKGSSTKSKRKP
ncbi:MAG: 50S ribosomal protein L17 [Acidobacteriota bacterium]